MYQHQWHTGESINLPTGKIVCIGRNYAAHAQELNNPIPSRPILFIKPSTCLQPFKEITLAKRLGEHHYEAELALLIGDTISYGDQDVLTKIAGVGLALDLTLRDVQSELKSKGHPWERAKAYDGSCPVTPFYPLKSSDELASSEYKYWQNGELKQHGKTELMLFNIERLLTEISESFTLMPGDIVLTGTPEGVGVLNHGDELQLQYQEQAPLNAKVVLKP